ncbi:sulfotransferase [Ketobacter sp.]|uniref:sulfotransferase n=1 Tax=Ketobacter sp. TaxID=2083498 RepID=UPI0025BD315E|nr:sulfotransferase [Ketobacter sp.]
MDSSSDYSALDRWVHNIAFASRGAQVALSDLEDKLFAGALQPITPERPVFVTGLPRAGTTLLLEMLEASGEFGVHTYRDMPLLLTPLLWSRLSRWFRREATMKERAHGDGMLVSEESPEAFEETLWAEFWPKQYQAHWVEPWDPRFTHPEFEQFFRRHIRKILLLRATAERQPRRYLSKNNMNIARLPYLVKRFPDAQVLVPFRQPLQHAASLLRQHLGFLQLHQSDPFARRYMRGIGHYDFGANLKPINFGNWMQPQSLDHADSLSFWLQYWCATYRTLLSQLEPRIRLFSFDHFCKAPHHSLTTLGALLELEQPAALLAQAERVSPPKAHAPAGTAIDPDLLAEAQQLYTELCRQAHNG